ncbi:rap guanine nucleotide exchange factor 4-like [Alosa pseudoharengus]|uniref:rap guanine nucleotide exchange factor 4-like n=1 Tax=Alosa pseudoharengus TaxID=34774 RepID=UPI003F891D77
MPLTASVEDVMAALKAPAGDNMLIRLKSSGAREQLKMDARAISILGINERLFLCSASQAAELTPLQGQLGPEANRSTLENMSAKVMAAQLTSYDWELFSAMHETELLYYVLGREQFPNSLTANLERFIRRFNVVTYWVVTELCLCAELSKRARLMRKFIKMATV